MQIVVLGICAVFWCVCSGFYRRVCDIDVNHSLPEHVCCYSTVNGVLSNAQDKLKIKANLDLNLVDALDKVL